MVVKIKLGLPKTKTIENKENTNYGVEISNTYAGELVVDLVSIDRLELDPENKRKMILTLEDAMYGIKKDDPEYELKKEDCKKLESLSKSISEGQQINPIFVYRYGDKCRLISGERRTLASALIGKTNIIARIASKKPSTTELKMLQWIENNEREDLSLAEKIESLEALLGEYFKTNSDKLTAQVLSDLTKMSLPHARRYQMILESDNDIKDAVKLGKLNNFRLIELLCSTKDTNHKRMLLSEALSGKQLHDIEVLKKELEAGNKVKRILKRGRKREKINLGNVKPSVVKVFIGALTSCSFLDKQLLNEIHNIYSEIKWHDINGIQRSFKKIVSLVESGVGQLHNE